MSEAYDVVVAIVDRELSNKVIKAIMETGVKSVTILSGRSKDADIPESQEFQPDYFLGYSLAIEREYILILTPKDKTSTVFEAALHSGDLQKPGRGLVFVMEVKQVGGL